jgi:hypothetical protein
MTDDHPREPLTDEQLVEMLRAADPVRQWPKAPWPTAEQIRMLPKRASRSRFERLRRALGTTRVRLSMATATLITATIAAITSFTTTGTTTTTGSPPPSAPPATSSTSTSHASPPPYQLVGQSQNASDYLLATAASVAAQPPGRRRPVTHVRLQEFRADLTNPNPDQTTRQTAFDREIWWKADRSAYTRVTTLPAPPSGVFQAAYTGTLPDSLPHQTYRDKAGSGERNDDGIRLLIANPSADPDRLASQLAATHQGSSSTQQTMSAIAALYRQHDLTPAQRAAVLTVLAGTDVRYWGEVQDRAGRHGIAYATDVAGPAAAGQPREAMRYLLVIDEDNGQLLSYEEELLQYIDMQATTAVPVAVSYYVLYLNSSTEARMP